MKRNEICVSCTRGKEGEKARAESSAFLRISE